MHKRRSSLRTPTLLPRSQPAPLRSGCTHDPSRQSEAAAREPIGDGIRTETVLAGGVSSDIRIVRAVTGDYVVKRALKKLRVEADWFADPARSSIEVDGLRVMADLLGQPHVPRVLWVDEEAHSFAMELIDAKFENWKQQLLRGHVDPATARTAGHLLGQLHSRSASRPQLAARFANQQPFLELRIRPFFERVAQRYPEMAAIVMETSQHLLTQRSAFVHGDYSPKNLLARNSELVILDCEVAHWGDPRFDVAFCMAHLILKSLRRGAPMFELVAAGRSFLAEYRRCGPASLDTQFGRLVGCLLLARLVGDSRVDYLDDLDFAKVHQLAVSLIMQPSCAWEQLLDRLSSCTA